MDLINDYICHCPLGKQRALATRLQKYHAISFSASPPREYVKMLLLMCLHANRLVCF